MIALKEILKNKIAGYLTTRYITYALQFVNSMVIAAKLGPYYLGIYGFILLILNYFQLINLGIPNSYNVLYIHHKEDQQERNNYTINSFVLTGYLGIVVIICYLFYVFGLYDISQKYDINKWAIWIAIIAILNYFQSMILAVFRLNNQLGKVAFCQSIGVILITFCIIIGRGEFLISLLVASQFISCLICLILAFCSGIIPTPKSCIISINYQRAIIGKGFFLFLYNSCFYFIITADRTIISNFYSVDEFGLFTFSYTLANALMLLLDALNFAVFPKVIGSLSGDDIKVVDYSICKYRVCYITIANTLVYLGLLFFPLIVLVLPKYSLSLRSIELVALTTLMGANYAGYSDVLIARNKEKTLAIVSFAALCLNCIVAILLVHLFRVPFDFVIIATMITYAFFSVTIIYFGSAELENTPIRRVLSISFPLRQIVPFLASIAICMFGYNYLLPIPIIAFLLLNFRQISQIKQIAITLLKNPKKIDI